MNDESYQTLLSTLLDLLGESSDLEIPEDMVHTQIQVDEGWFEEFRTMLKNDAQPYDCRIDGWKTVGTGDPDGSFVFYRTTP